MENILIISDTQSYLLVSLQKKFEEAEYNIINAKADLEELSKIKEQSDAIFIFADEQLLEKKNVLIYLKDKAIEGEIPVFVTGASEELLAIKQTIPQYLIRKVFQRPINISQAAEEVDHFIKTEGKQNKKKILVVDDSGAMLRNVKGWLEDKYQIILANSGAMAIKYLATNRPDLVLLDYEMPIVDGKQVLEMIRSELDFSDIPVIFLTSKDDKKSVMDVMSLKPEGYLLKTMEPSAIKQAVDDFFEKRKAERK